MLCRVIIFALSRHRHHMFALSTFCNPREQGNELQSSGTSCVNRGNELQSEGASSANL